MTECNLCWIWFDIVRLTALNRGVKLMIMTCTEELKIVVLVHVLIFFFLLFFYFWSTFFLGGERWCWGGGHLLKVVAFKTRKFQALLKF